MLIIITILVLISQLMVEVYSCGAVHTMKSYFSSTLEAAVSWSLEEPGCHLSVGYQ